MAGGKIYRGPVDFTIPNMAPYQLAQKFSMAPLKYPLETVVGPVVYICHGPVSLL